MQEQAWAIVDGIKDQLPGLKLYQDIYNDESVLSRDLRKKIVSAYMGFVELCMEISRYCLQTSLRKKIRTPKYEVSDDLLGIS